ncbi:cytochrome o ubiquinol oxidase subunit IV [Roseomonas sp. KE0001]|uniref:cytochrome o ubiquinol oxidase subunit IV n=1 Tax=unclassified Roseomonas TaxID=2617492 RepID=UPI0018DF3A28|nr:cytochrome o ubiquinol oxidase subunit IV [Roseomonas sp. KE0001]MBI0434482.1 cytochrome o ubiquinol oxidase subunit IV [Roseomonas sp. KE0001]
MSAHPEAAGQHAHAAHHDDHHDEGAHGSLKGYLIGFGLSVVLTAIPFWLVMGEVLESSVATALLIMGFAVVQIVVHMFFFLHMNSQSEEGWNMLALIFTLVVVGITIAGSLWVMYHLNANMMPQMLHDMRSVP